MRQAAGIRAAVCAALLIAMAAPARANRESAALRAKGSAQIYNLDRDLALTSFRDAIAADPQDSGAYRGLATTLWLNITFRRGNMTVDDYLGRVTKPNPSMAPPPPETAAAYRDAIDRAIGIARKRIEQNPQSEERRVGKECRSRWSPYH